MDAAVVNDAENEGREFLMQKMSRFRLSKLHYCCSSCKLNGTTTVFCTIADEHPPDCSCTYFTTLTNCSGPKWEEALLHTEHGLDQISVTDAENWQIVIKNPRSDVNTILNRVLCRQCNAHIGYRYIGVAGLEGRQLYVVRDKLVLMAESPVRPVPVYLLVPGQVIKYALNQKQKC